MDNLEYRSLLLKGIAGVSMVLTFYGIRFLRSKPPASGSAVSFSQDLPFVLRTNLPPSLLQRCLCSMMNFICSL
jgi:hypothetical protein